MKRTIITISDNGNIIVPSETKMSIAEIADLFGIYYQIAKRHIRAIEKLGVVDGDYSMNCIVEGKTIYTEYYGLEMVIALAFRVQSEKAGIFRRWAVRRITQNRTQIVFTSLNNKTMMN